MAERYGNSPAGREQRVQVVRVLRVHAHLFQGGLVAVGTRVWGGQVVAQAHDFEQGGGHRRGTEAACLPEEGAN